MPLPIIGVFFRPFYQVRSVWMKLWFVGVFEVCEFGSVVKIELAQFLVAFDLIFAQNLGVIREQLVVGACRCQYRVSHRILL